jgi:hypothetical protein
MGFRVEVIDPTAADPYRLGIALLEAIAGQPGFAWRKNGAALTWLVGTPRLGERLATTAGVDEVVAADAADLEAWRVERRPALLYPETGAASASPARD